MLWQPNQSVLQTIQVNNDTEPCLWARRQVPINPLDISCHNHVCRASAFAVLDECRLDTCYKPVNVCCPVEKPQCCQQVLQIADCCCLASPWASRPPNCSVAPGTMCSSSARPSLGPGLCQTAEYPQLKAGHLQGLHKLLLHLQGVVPGQLKGCKAMGAGQWVQAVPGICWSWGSSTGHNRSTAPVLLRPLVMTVKALPCSRAGISD